MTAVEDGQRVYVVVALDVDVDGSADQDEGSISVTHSSEVNVVGVFLNEDDAEYLAWMYGAPTSVRLGPQAYVITANLSCVDKEVK